MPPMTILGVLGGLALFLLLCVAGFGWCQALVHLLLLGWRARQAPAAGPPPELARHRRKIVQGARLFVGGLLGALVVHGLGTLLGWVSG
jgi:hypothetical protein